MGKRFLLVAMDMGSTPPGVVFKTLARALAAYASLEVVCPDFDETFGWEGISRIPAPPYHVHRWKTIRRYWKWLCCNPDDSLWARRAMRAVMPALGQYDAVISLTSMNYFPSILLGRKIAAKLGKPWWIYSVDGIPSPTEWLEGDSLTHDRMALWLDRVCAGADGFFSSNPYMMDYQRRIMPHMKGRWDYLPTPHNLTSSCPFVPHEGLVFLYTGTLYGLRRIDGLLEGFRAFRKGHPQAKLVFVGDTHPSYKEQASAMAAEGAVEFLPFQRDVNPLLERADVLLDIGADIPDDVFLSSKIISYLPMERPILAITGKNSPARNMLGGIPSIIHCSNDAAQVREALERCVKAVGAGIGDRAGARALFQASNVARKLFETICL